VEQDERGGKKKPFFDKEKELKGKTKTVKKETPKKETAKKEKLEETEKKPKKKSTKKEESDSDGESKKKKKPLRVLGTSGLTKEQNKELNEIFKNSDLKDRTIEGDDHKPENYTHLIVGATPKRT